MLFDSKITKVREPPVKESKLKALLKRSSEPFMGIQISQQVYNAQISFGYKIRYMFRICSI